MTAQDTSVLLDGLNSDGQSAEASQHHLDEAHRANASAQADQLLTRDRGYCRSFFPAPKLVAP